MITPQQLKALQAGFHQMGFDDQERHEYISQYTDGRVNSTKLLTFDEARKLLTGMYQNASSANSEEARKVVGIIYKLSFHISFLNASFKDCHTPEDYEMNKAKINVFCRNRTRFHKNLTEMTLEELKAVSKQLEKIARDENEDFDNL